MSNRNFDNRVIIQRLQEQNYARNLYKMNVNGQKLINNPQNSDGTSSRLTTFVSGAQTDYFRGLLGAGETVSLGGIFGISPFITPTVPLTPPTAPIITGIIDGNQQLTVTFRAPVSDGGAAITDYQYQVSQVGSSPPTPPPFISIGPTVSPFTITGLTNGTPYDVVIKAINRIGDGPNSIPVTGTPATIPSAPTITGITDGNQQLTVTFAAPTSNGGAAITDYQYQTNNGSFTSIGPIVSPFIITGLTNGTPYSVVIKAINRIGSTNSDPVTGTPATIPDAPTITGITPGDQRLTVAFTAPTSDGGAAIRGYQYSTNNGNTFSSEVPVPTNSQIIITGLTNGTSYTVIIRAVNRIDNGPNSNSVTATPVTVPYAPTITGITDGNTQLTVAFTPPADGGATITGYQYLVNNSSYTCAGLVTDISGNTFTITGLTNGTTYQVFISAVNRIGNGLPSNREPGTPATVPSAPTITVITPENQQLSVAFTAPTSNGGAAITNYLFQKNIGESFVSTGTTTSPFTITGLTNGTSYSVVIRAVNRMDPNGGTISDPRVVATPISVPSAPTITGITAGNTSLSVAFTDPSSTGGSPITNYEYSTNDGSTFTALNPVDTTSSITIPNISDTPLTNGTSYPVRIRAITLIGNGDPSAPVPGVPIGPPTAPTITGITEENGQLSVAFSPPTSDGGAFILDYQYAYNGGSFTSAGRTTSPITITGLTNGTSYSIQIKAANYIGAGLPSNPETAKPQLSGPNVLSAIADNDQLNATLTCSIFSSFTPTPSASRFISSNQYDAYVESITTNATNTIVVIGRFEYPRPVVASYIILSDGVRISQISNPFPI